MMQLSELAVIVGGTHAGPDVAFSGVSTDSRNLARGDLFVALQGPRFDGNAYALAAQAAGAAAVLVSRPLAGVPQVVVEDTRQALGRLAAAWRSRLPVKIVGVTGSNGKTTVKEMLAAILAEAGSTLATRGNLNNDIGLPQTLLALRPEHRFAVAEMGANHPGEIAYLAGLARPDVALINNAGSAHLEGFGSLEGVARAKGEMIGALGLEGVAVLNTDDRFWPLWRELAGQRSVLAFGTGREAQVRLLPASYGMAADAEGFTARFLLAWQGREWQMRLSLPGRHNALNAAAAAGGALALGLSMDQVQAGLAKLYPVPGRLQPLRCMDAWVFNDTYNANPASFAVGLEVVASLAGEAWLALGGFGELGETGPQLHGELGREAKRRGVVRLFATGPLADRAVAEFGPGATYHETQEELIRVLRETLHKDVVLLVKGSRSQRMERVVDALCGAES